MAKRDRQEWLKELQLREQEADNPHLAFYYRSCAQQIACPTRTSFQGVKITDKKGPRNVSE